MTTKLKNEMPILLNNEMVRAILAGRKTQTRRVMKPQPTYVVRDGSQVAPYWLWINGKERRAWQDGGDQSLIVQGCPYGVPGDRLWVRETWAALSKTPDVSYSYDDCQLEYRADTKNSYPGEWPEDEARGNQDAPKWRPSIHMPRWASRITLEITDVRVQRVHRISEADANAEGCMLEAIDKDWVQCRRWFQQLWDSIYAKNGQNWEANPWVWAITFKQIGEA